VRSDAQPMHLERTTTLIGTDTLIDEDKI